MLFSNQEKEPDLPIDDVFDSCRTGMVPGSLALTKHP